MMIPDASHHPFVSNQRQIGIGTLEQLVMTRSKISRAISKTTNETKQADKACSRP